MNEARREPRSYYINELFYLVNSPHCCQLRRKVYRLFSMISSREIAKKLILWVYFFCRNCFILIWFKSSECGV